MKENPSRQYMILTKHALLWEWLIVQRTQYPSLVMEVRLIADKSVFSSSFSLGLTDLWQRLMEGREKQRAASVEPPTRTTAQWVEGRKNTNRSVPAGSVSHTHIHTMTSDWLPQPESTFCAARKMWNCFISWTRLDMVQLYCLFLKEQRGLIATAFECQMLQIESSCMPCSLEWKRVL